MARSTTVARSPKDTFITVYGRKPVQEALDDVDLRVDKVVLADDARGEPIRAILAAARTAGCPSSASAHRVKGLAGNGRHRQGVLADVVAPRMQPVDEFLLDLGNDPAAVLVLDRVTNPANVGMVLRSATAAGLDGVLLPRRGAPAIDPLVVKASAGVAFRAPVLPWAIAEDDVVKCADVEAITQRGPDSAGASLLDADLPRRVALVLGNETDGPAPAVARCATGCWRSRWTAGGVAERRECGRGGGVRAAAPTSVDDKAHSTVG